MLTLSAPRRVAIVGANRIPFARSNTAYAEASNQDMLTAALQGLIDRFDLHGLRLGEVAAGAVLKLSRDIALTRESVLGTTLGPDTPARDWRRPFWSPTRSPWARSRSGSPAGWTPPRMRRSP